MPIDSLHHRVGKTLTRVISILVVAATVSIPTAYAGNAGNDQSAITSVSVEQLKTIAKDEGYAVSIDDDGDLMWKIEGFRTYLLISDDGEYIQFQSSFEDTEATMETVNAWNQTKRYSRSYLDDDGDPILELDLDLEGGVTHARILSYLKTCRVSFRGWLNEVID